MGFGVSWSMFRQFVPPLGMTLVATVTTTPSAKATTIDLVTIGIHLTGAMMLFVGYAMCEAKNIGWGIFEKYQPETSKRIIKNPERAWRKSYLFSICFWYVIFCVI